MKHGRLGLQLGFTGLVALMGVASGITKTIEQVHGFEPHFVLPEDAGMVSIKAFGAVGDGEHDDTEAFKKAFGRNHPRAIYIPSGTYLLKDQIRYGINDDEKKKVCVIGESRSSTTLKLAANSSGFGDPEKPKAFFHTRHPDQQGEQNFHNYLYHLTIEIGQGNPGAIAVNYHSNNTGAMKDVTVCASAPVASPGHTGIACSDWQVGPSSLRYVTVDGFGRGIALTKAANYMTLEHITLRHCITGILAGTASIRELRVKDARQPLRSHGMTVLCRATLEGDGLAAVENLEGGLLVRDLQSKGFSLAVRSGTPNGNAPPRATEYVSHPPQWNWRPASHRNSTLNLPVVESPELQYPQSKDAWTILPAKGDISAPLQEAINSGARHIYIPGGYGSEISRTIHVKNQVKRIAGIGNAYIRFSTEGEPVFRLEEGKSEIVLFSRIYSNYGSDAGARYVHAAPRTMVVRHGSGSYKTLPSAQGGRLFLDGVVADSVHVRHIDTWARLLNTERGGLEPTVINEGGQLWVLGQKTEDYATKLKTVAGGFTELLGGIYRQNWDQTDFDRAGIGTENRPPLFEIDNAHASLTYLSRGPAKPYTTLVRETRGDQTRELRRSEHGGSAALFVGYQKRPNRK